MRSERSVNTMHTVQRLYLRQHHRKHRKRLSLHVQVCGFVHKDRRVVASRAAFRRVPIQGWNSARLGTRCARPCLEQSKARVITSIAGRGSLVSHRRVFYGGHPTLRLERPVSRITCSCSGPQSHLMCYTRVGSSYDGGANSAPQPVVNSSSPHVSLVNTLKHRVLF